MKYEKLMESANLNFHDPDFKRELFKSLQREGYGEIEKSTINPEQFMLSFMEKMGVAPVTISMKTSEILINLVTHSKCHKVRFQIIDRRVIPEPISRRYQQIIPDWPMPLSYDLISVRFTKKTPELQVLEVFDSNEIILSFSHLDFLPNRADLTWKDIHINKQEYTSSLSKIIEDTFVPIFG